jgi:signal transduction histidine kinase
MVILLDDAVGATPNGGQVSVVGRIGETDNVEISIIDTGLAMSDEDMKSLEATNAEHARSTPSWGYTGRSGLLYCAAVIGALNGTIAVHRADTFGNTVMISLPLAPEEAA